MVHKPANIYTKL